MANFSPRFCEICKEPKNDLRNGTEIILRCTCDWARGFHERIKHTVRRDFWDPKIVDPEDKNEIKLKTIDHWDPPIFANGGPGRFKNFIKIQKANAILRLNDFCFKLLKKDSNGVKHHALDHSIERGRNLFIRGPYGSGRGTLLANIKFFAALRDISSTPVPYDWAVFKSEIIAADSWSKDGALAKADITEHYRQVKLLTLEGLKGEGSIYSDDKRPKRFRSASSIDEMLTRRQMASGSMVFTSDDFIRQIGDSIGDRLPEILTSSNTVLILLFSPLEADGLLDGLIKRLTLFRASAEKLVKRDSLKTAADNELALQDVEQALYIEHAFPEIPATTGVGAVKLKAESLHMKLGIANKYPDEMKRLWTDFCTDREAKNLKFQEMMNKTYVSVVSECKQLAAHMTEKEMLDTGRMMSMACQPAADIKEHIKNARNVREAMKNQ